MYIVLSPPPGGAGHVQVLINGKTPNAGDAGSDVHAGIVTVNQQRLYNIVSEPRDQDETITLRLSPGMSAYSVHVRLAAASIAAATCFRSPASDVT